MKIINCVDAKLLGIKAGFCYSPIKNTVHLKQLILVCNQLYKLFEPIKRRIYETM